MPNSKESEQQITPHQPEVKKTSLVPEGFTTLTTRKKALQEQHDISKNRSGSLSQAVERANAIENSLNLEQRINVLEKRKALIALSGSALSTISQEDPLEQYRKEQELDKKRNRLLSELTKSYSLDAGLELLNGSTEAKQEYTSMEEVNSDFPNLTSAEVTLCSLLEEFPRLYLTTGKSFASGNEKEKLLALSVPYVSGVTIDGLEIASDLINVEERAKDDPYIDLGVTGAPIYDETLELVEFKPAIKKIFSELIPLAIKSDRLFTRIWDKFEVSLQDGFTKIDRHALEEVIEREINSRENLHDVLESLGENQKTEFENVKKNEDIRFGKTIVVNAMNGQVYGAKDTIRLMGLLNETPGIFFGENPFEGYMIPYSTGILFVDQNSGSRNYYPFYPYYIREAVESVYYEDIDATRHNHVMTGLFSDLMSSINSNIMHQAEVTGEDPSTLEGMRFDTKLKYNIDIDISPFVELHRIGLYEYSTDGKYKREANIKIGEDEFKQILNTLRLVPSEMLENVTSIKKEMGRNFDFEAFLRGASELGHYEPGTKSITLIQNIEHPFASLRGEERAMHASTILHEIGHSVMLNLPDEKRGEWDTVSDGDNKSNDPNDFLTSYARSSKDEDFAEHFMAYIFHGDEFREGAKFNPNLAKKYEFIKKLFADFTGQAREYPQISPFTLVELVGYADNEITKMEMETAVILQNRYETEQEIELRKSKENIVKSVDSSGATDVLDPQETEQSLPEDITVNERVEEEERISYKRNAISDFIEYFAGEDTEEVTNRWAHRLYNLIEEGEVDRAFAFARKHTDELYWEDIENRITVIADDIEQGNDFIGERKTFN